MQESGKRMMAPDVLKIIASLFVIVVHHKRYQWPSFAFEYKVFHLALLGICAAISVFVFIKAKKQGFGFWNCIKKASVSLMCWVGFAFFKKMPVSVFIILTSYFMANSMKKLDNPIKGWYSADNILPRLVRFYLPFIPIFIICLLYKIFVLDYTYSVLEVPARFILGGFKPGSYYLPILTQLVIIFPLINIFVRRYKAVAVGVCTLITLAYDVVCTYIGFSDIAYKFLVFRFIAHIGLGAYACLTDFRLSKIAGSIMLILGAVYSYGCIYTQDYVPTIFFQWQETSFVTAFYVYPVMAFVMNLFKDSHYTDSLFSRCIQKFAGATYHIFLVQLMYYTTVGFPYNTQVSNFLITMPVNLVVVIVISMIYYHFSAPRETRMISSLKKRISKSK